MFREDIINRMVEISIAYNNLLVREDKEEAHLYEIKRLKMEYNSLLDMISIVNI